MKLSKGQEKLLEMTKELLVFGSNVLTKAEIYPYKTRLKKSIHFMSMGACQSYSEAILKLVTPPNIYDKAAEVIFRSLVENLINISYVYSSRNEVSTRNFIVDSITDRIDFADKYKKFFKKYKHKGWDLDFAGIKTEQDWDNFISDRENDISSVERRRKEKYSKKLLSLRDRAEKADEKLEKSTTMTLSKETSLEYYYVQYYKFFSQISHLTMPGLERFFNSSENVLEIDGKSEDMDRLLSLTYQIYYSNLVFFAKKFEIYDKKDFEEFENFSKKLVGSISS